MTYNREDYEAYKRFCEHANINGVYLRSNLSETEIKEFIANINIALQE